jgi:hypothetical protein
MQAAVGPKKNHLNRRLSSGINLYFFACFKAFFAVAAHATPLRIMGSTQRPHLIHDRPIACRADITQITGKATGSRSPQGRSVFDDARHGWCASSRRTVQHAGGGSRKAATE